MEGLRDRHSLGPFRLLGDGTGHLGHVAVDRRLGRAPKSQKAAKLGKYFLLSDGSLEL